MTPLEAHIRARMSKHGPLTVQQFMEDALGHADFGYYMTRDPLGEAGDFTTAPEVSQIFGELIGAWLASVWQSMGAPQSFHLVEMGPGRGTLMNDALRAVKNVPGFLDAASIALIEMSPVLREHQRETLASSGHDAVTWYRDLSQVPPGPSLIVANEFFDAMPVRQFVAQGGQWYERLISVDPDSHDLCFMLADEVAKPHFLPPGIEADRDGEIVEVSPPGLRVMHTLADRLVHHDGAALIIDYGHESSAIGETLQALRGHKYARVLDAPGEQDLTVHVDFEALCRVAGDAGAAVHGPVSQAVFLSRLGIDIRLQRLLASARDETEAQSLLQGARRLIDREAMGELFRVIAVASPRLLPSPGFAD